MAISYLHYYYANSGSPFTSADFFRAKRKSLLDMQLKAFKNQKRALSAQVSKIPIEYAEVLSILTDTKQGDKIRNSIYQATNEGMPDKILFQGENGTQLSAGSIPNTKMENIEAKAGDIAATIGNFQQALLDTLNQAYQNLYANGTFEEYCQQVIANYIQGNPTGPQKMGSALNQEILDNFLHHNGFLKNSFFKNSHAGRVQDSLNKLILFAEALPDFEQYAGTYSTKTSGGNQTIDGLPHFFQIIAGKTQGLYNMVKGDGAELAAVLAEKKAINLVGQHLQDINKAFAVSASGLDTTSGVSIMSKFTSSNDYDEIFRFNAAPIHSETFSKPDVKVSYNENGVFINYGLNVKNYALQSSNNGMDKYYINAKISEGTSLYRAFSNIFSGSGMYYIYQLAGGHGNGRTNLKSAPGIRYTNKQLDEIWNAAKDCAVAGNLLGFLGGLAKDNTLFMVANGRVLGLDDILQDIINDQTHESYSIKGAAARSTYMSKNKWKETKTSPHAAALERSDQAIDGIASLLNEAKIITHLKIFFS